MVAELNERAAARQEYSRRRMARADADVDFINPRNAHFNKKIERWAVWECVCLCVVYCVYFNSVSVRVCLCATPTSTRRLKGGACVGVCVVCWWLCAFVYACATPSSTRGVCSAPLAVLLGLRTLWSALACGGQKAAFSSRAWLCLQHACPFVAALAASCPYRC